MTTDPAMKLSDKALDPRALEALKNSQRQLDMDGVEVGVSRQALDELISAYEARSALPSSDMVERLESAETWLRETRDGSRADGTPFEAATALTAQAARIAEQDEVLRAARIFADRELEMRLGADQINYPPDHQATLLLTKIDAALGGAK